MSKKLLSVLLFGAAVLLTTSTVVSCKDYDDDINNLQEQITKNSEAIQALQALLNKGVVITNVAKNAEGVLVTTTDANGNTSSYQLYNGADGKDADVWTIVNDEWYKNGVATGLAAKGDKGETGAQGPQGEQGPAGKDGVDGKNGVDGKDGKDGVDGKDGKDGKDGVDGKDGKDGVDGKDGKDGVDGKDGKDGADGGYYKPNQETGYFDFYAADGTLKTAGTAANGAPSWKANTLTAVVEGDKVIFTNVDGVAGTVAISTKLAVKSIVYQPEFYYHGIPAIRVESYNYNPIRTSLADPDITVNQALATEGKITVYPYQTSVTPDFEAEYYFNPTNAKVDLAVANFSWELLAGKEYTKALAATDLYAIQKVEKGDNDLIKVTGKIDNANTISNIAADNQVDVVALQYKDADNEEVTSDFAALKQFVITDFFINHNAKGTGDQPKAVSGENHLATIASNAVAVDGMGNLLNDHLTVLYDGTIDLDEYINVHYNLGAGDVVWGTNKTIQKKGFKLEYELIGYINGANVTNESQHATLEGSVLTPKRISGKTPNPAIVGRRPLVRVKLIDTNTQYPNTADAAHRGKDQIVAVGYIAVEIIQKEVEDYTLTGPYTVTKDYTVNCGADIDLEKPLTWAQVEEDIFALVALSREQFDSRYELDVYPGQTYAKQFKATDLSDAGLIAEADRFGDVKSTVSDPNVHQTDVLTWTVTNAVAYNYFNTGNPKPTTKVVWVRFTPKTAADKKLLGNIYVPLTWTPATIKLTPTANIVNASDKAQAIWYEKYPEFNAAGYNSAPEANRQALHMHVLQAIATNNVNTFELGVANSTFLDKDGNVVSQANFHQIFEDKLTAAGYTAQATSGVNIAYKFVMPDTDKAGSSETGAADAYTLSLSPDALTVRATQGGTTEDVAIIDPVTGVITYQPTDFAKDILNYKDHLYLKQGESLTLKVQIVATTCAPAADVANNNDIVWVSVLRPLSAEGTEIPVIDSDPATHKRKLVASFDPATRKFNSAYQFRFTDWRDMNNADIVYNSTAFGSPTDIYTYYNIQAIEMNPLKPVQSDFATKGVFKNLDPNDFIIVYAGPGQTIDYTNGTITGAAVAPTNADQGEVFYLKKTTATVDSFTAKIPVKITYAWGVLYTDITVKVTKTVSNAKKR